MFKKLEGMIFNAVMHWVSGRGLTTIISNVISYLILGLQNHGVTVEPDSQAKLIAWLIGMITTVSATVISFAHRPPSTVQPPQAKK